MLFVVTVMFFTHLRVEALSFIGLSPPLEEQDLQKETKCCTSFYMRHVVSCCECFFFTGLVNLIHWTNAVYTIPLTSQRLKLKQTVQVQKTIFVRCFHIGLLSSCVRLWHTGVHRSRAHESLGTKRDVSLWCCFYCFCVSVFVS